MFRHLELVQAREVEFGDRGAAAAPVGGPGPRSNLYTCAGTSPTPTPPASHADPPRAQAGLEPVPTNGAAPGRQ